MSEPSVVAKFVINPLVSALTKKENENLQLVFGTALFAVVVPLVVFDYVVGIDNVKKALGNIIDPI
ncbi:hypothetical protein JW758_04360 [Candidatus Peregrinibacteria bacterium]|nr:hypothetical protein [Candidatus Peregrinibacteria bacterium]